jgi:hypothetical protein
MKKLTLTFLTILFCLFTVTCFAQPTKISNITKQASGEIYKVTLGAENDEVVIGDEKNSATFKNQVTFKKWFNEKQGDFENSLSIIPPADLIPNATVTSSNGQILIRNNKIGFYYNKDPTSEDNLKFGLILYERPQSNVFQFQLEGWEDWEFLYQPPLKNVNPDGSTWEDNGKGGIRTQSLPEANGSWCVYHKTKRDYWVGLTPNYQIGKFGVFYRPRLFDADGNFLGWADINIVNGVYTFSIENIPQDAINKAKLPLISNDTFGNTGTPSTGEDADSVFPNASKSITTPVYSGTLTKITLYCKISSGTPKFQGALYSDVSGTCTARLAYDATGTTVGASYGPIDSSVSYGSIVAGTQYWLGHKSNSTDLFNYKYDTGESGEMHYNDAITAYPDPWTDVNNNTQRLGIYATYTPSGGATGSLLNNCVINNALIQ